MHEDILKSFEVGGAQLEQIAKAPDQSGCDGYLSSLPCNVRWRAIRESSCMGDRLQ